MADGALKDAEFLAPIVSLDEFMESLDSEPPFENLSLVSGKATPNSGKDGSECKYSGLTPSDHVEGNPDKSPDLERRVNVESGVVPSDARSSEIDGGLKLVNDPIDKKLTDDHAEVRLTGDTQSGSRRTELKASQNYAEEIYSGSQLYSKTDVPAVVLPCECIWEGMLQLNISDTHPVMGIFKSGERTSVKDWPGLVEIKGRVRLDAFEKFLQELPLSRTRAVMVLHFVSKESSSKNNQSTLRQVADSYILDARVGFAEPMPQVELYLSPPLNKTNEMLSKIISKEQVEAFNAIDFGLIGIVVWRKNHLTSTILPTSLSSHHKNSSKLQYLSSRRQHDSNVNSNLKPKPSYSTGFKTTQIGPVSDDDDDIPPGFGPPVARDPPEFNFNSGGPNRSVSPLVQNPRLIGPGMAPLYSSNQTSRPVEQVRELIQKHGPNQAIASPRNWNDRFGVTIQPWNDDEDDDDTPEWQPHNLQNQFPPQQKNLEIGPRLLNHSYGIFSHNSLPKQSLQPPMNVKQNIRSMRDFTTQGNNLHPSNFNYRAPAQGIAWCHKLALCTSSTGKRTLIGTKLCR